MFNKIIDMIENGKLRLTNGLHKYAGRVEMYWNSEWRTVCYDGWDELDAQVVCRQFNYFATAIQVLGTCMWNIMPYTANIEYYSYSYFL